MFAKLAVAFAVVAASVAANSGHTARADDFIGGGGGSVFAPINCPSGKAVVGLAGRSGEVIDTMQLVCGKGDGSPDTVDPRRIGPSVGGSPVSAMCSPLFAATSIQVNVREFNGHVVVSQIVLRCDLVLDGSSGSRPVFGGGGGNDAGTSTCPANHYVAGFQGRVGSFIDAVAVTCRPRSALN